MMDYRDVRYALRGTEHRLNLVMLDHVISDRISLLHHLAFPRLYGELIVQTHVRLPGVLVLAISLEAAVFGYCVELCRIDATQTIVPVQGRSGVIPPYECHMRSWNTLEDKLCVHRHLTRREYAAVFCRTFLEPQAAEIIALDVNDAFFAAQPAVELHDTRLVDRLLEFGAAYHMPSQRDFFHGVNVAVVPLRKHIVLVRNGAQPYGLATIVLAAADNFSERIVVTVRFDGIYLGR